jgi:hypothetical protein
MSFLITMNPFLRTREPLTGAIGILGGVSMDIPQIDELQALFQTHLPLPFPIPQWSWKANEESLHGK